MRRLMLLFRELSTRPARVDIRDRFSVAPGSSEMTLESVRGDDLRPGASRVIEENNWFRYRCREEDWAENALLCEGVLTGGFQFLETSPADSWEVRVGFEI